MVAITVILAAVIAAFVLDIGPGETDPSATFSADVSEEDGNSDTIVDVELQSLGSNTDGIVVTEDTSDNGNFIGSPLEVSGQSTDYQSNNMTSDTALVAYSGGEDLSGGSDLSDVDNFAIIDNLDEIEDEE